ncbi:MAG: c-type cytochrome [Planctomycetaceae bacterium]|nr:c-type cytochrome [Planctomycetaceae bacterium]
MQLFFDRTALSLLTFFATAVVPMVPVDAQSSLDAGDIALLQAEVTQLTEQPLTDEGVRRLIQIDVDLGYPSPREVGPLQREILLAISASQERGLEHLRHVFESQPERRGPAAAALARATTDRPNDLQDWRYMVRSLTVVEGDDAVAVMTALRRFQQRATRGTWVRQVILIGLTLPTGQQRTAEELLQHWTSKPRTGRNVTPWSLAEYQTWFADEFAMEPAAVLPTDPAERRWDWTGVLNALEASGDEDSTVDGKVIYEKAGCTKCHRRGDIGENFGPDLTSLGWRRTRKEIVRAILYPSHDLNEEYPSVSVVTKDGRTLAGMMSAGPENSLVIVSQNASRQQISRDLIDEIVPQKISGMPEGTLEPLTHSEIRALFEFLTSTEGVPRPHGDTF